MKAVAAVFAAIAFASVAARGQGQFVFNTHDPTAQNDVIFAPCGYPVSSPDFFVAVFAGPDASHRSPLSPTLALNRTGAGAGYTSPFAEIYTVPGMAAGASAVVGYQMFQGTTLADAIARGPVALATAQIVPITITRSRCN